ncbi:MAG: hypothetical protein ACRBF0_23530 [Calditrichia bacterium]
MSVDHTRSWRHQIPPTVEKRLQRPELLDRLKEGVALPVTILSAPAGYGKTTLLSQWAADAPKKIGWLTLDRFDNDPAVFLEHFVHTMQQIQPSIGNAVFKMLQAEKKPKMEDVLKRMLDDVALVMSDFVIVLDDYHVIYSPPIHAMMTFILTYLPPQMHVVVAAQTDPPFGDLARHRSYERLMEIRTPYFGFSVDECEKLLKQQFQIMLPYGPISAIVETATSRPIAINYVALLLEGDDKPVTFVDQYEKSDGDSLVMPFDALLEKVDAELQDFLRDISILDVFNADVAAAVSGCSDAAEKLVMLAGKGHVVEYVDSDKKWFRLHSLAREQLNLRLHRTGLEHLAEIHARAGKVFAVLEMPFPAFFHFSEAGEFDFAAVLVEQYSASWLQKGRMLSILNWLKVIPETTLEKRPQLAITSAWVALVGGDVEKVAKYLELADAAKGEGEAASKIAENIDAIQHFISQRQQ